MDGKNFLGSPAKKIPEKAVSRSGFHAKSFDEREIPRG
jgi:hypothetical protein